nr:hypothetical protein BaRGS_034424 [Batillaria attramentaria]
MPDVATNNFSRVRVTPERCPSGHYETQEVRHVAYCTCCKPHQMSFRRVRFNCPGRPRKQLVQFVGVADECACRPCSDGDPEPQQPYDY